MRLPGLMKCELLPVLLGDLSHMWILWSWSLSRSIHLDFPLLPTACLHMAFGNLLLLRLPLPCQRWNCHHKHRHHLDQGLHSATGAQDGLTYPRVPLHKILLRIKLLCPLYSSSGSSHRTPLRSSQSLFSQSRVCEHWPDNMQILFTVLAYVSINARVHHRLLSPQSASLARANEPPDVMWWQERQRLSEQKPGGHEEDLLRYWSFPLKAERNGFFTNWEENLSLCHIQTSPIWIPFVPKKEWYSGFMYSSAFQVKVQAHCTAQHAWILLDWKTAGNKCTHLAT